MTLQLEIVTYLFLVPIICVFGIVGNILTLAVLIRGQFAGGAFVYLKGLSIFDLLSLVFILPICLVRCPVCDFEDKYAFSFYGAYVYICIGDIFLKASVWTTMLLTVERCVVIVFKRQLHVSSRKSRFPFFALVGILVFTTVENIPTIYAFSIDKSDGSVMVTDYGRSTAYELYSWVDALLFQFVPFVVLFIFNIILAIYLIQHREVSKRLEPSFPQSFLDYRFTAERRTLLMLTGIIGLFLVTMVPCSVMQLIGIDVDYGSDLYTQFQMAVTVLISLNFSCNFLLYCFLNQRFWQVLKSLLCPCCLVQNRVTPAGIVSASVKAPCARRQSNSALCVTVTGSCRPGAQCHKDQVLVSTPQEMEQPGNSDSTRLGKDCTLNDWDLKMAVATRQHCAVEGVVTVVDETEDRRLAK